MQAKETLVNIKYIKLEFQILGGIGEKESGRRKGRRFEREGRGEEVVKTLLQNSKIRALVEASCHLWKSFWKANLQLSQSCQLKLALRAGPQVK